MMYDYRHMMEQVTLSDRKKEEIMDMLENKGTQKRRMPKIGAMVLAAVLAVGCVLSIAAGLPGQVYNFMNGTTMVALPGTDGENEVQIIGIPGDEAEAPIVVEDGRLWFVADGQRVDVTDKIDADTPYIYERTDPSTGNKGYVMLGGTVDDFGWAEYFEAETGISSVGGDNYDDTYLTIDGVRQSSYQMSPELVEKLNEDPSYALETVNRPWFQAAIDHLGIDW